jgi:hypothetical protein
MIGPGAGELVMGGGGLWAVDDIHSAISILLLLKAGIPPVLPLAAGA